MVIGLALAHPISASSAPPLKLTPTQQRLLISFRAIVATYNTAHADDGCSASAYDEREIRIAGYYASIRGTCSSAPTHHLGFLRYEDGHWALLCEVPSDEPTHDQVKDACGSKIPSLVIDALRYSNGGGSAY